MSIDTIGVVYSCEVTIKRNFLNKQSNNASDDLQYKSRKIKIKLPYTYRKLYSYSLTSY